MLTDVVKASQRAGQFCQQMLAYAGRGSLATSRIDLRTLLPQLDSLVHAALSKKTSLEYSLHDRPIFVEGDENQLLQVIMNLITNAAEAIGEEEGRITVSSQVAHYDATELRRLGPSADLPAGEYVRITVQDTGSGMDAETIARIFDPFFTTKFTGRGLGLSAVKGIITKHRGVIYLESKLGQGTTFTVLLPTTTGPEISEVASGPSVYKGDRKVILVVDDDTALRTILVKRLKHSGFDVLEAEDGQQAIDTFVKQPQAVDCVLLDMSMPKLSGEEVHKQLRDLRQDVPIILMSGFNESEIGDRFKGVKLDGTLQKPISADLLLETICSATAN